MNTKLALGIAVLLVVLGAGGYWYTTTSLAPITPQQSTACADFDPFKSLVLGTIGQSESTRDFLVSTTSTPSLWKFEWKRNSSEPFVTYPNLIAYTLSTPDLLYARDYGIKAPSNAEQERNADVVVPLLNQNVERAIQELGLIPSALNTSTFEKSPYCVGGDCSGWGSSSVRWGFTKDVSLYTVRVYGEPSIQAPVGHVEIVVACATQQNDYDHAYDILLSSTNKTKLSTFGGQGLLNIYKFSDDKSVVDVGLQYFSLKGDKATLITQGSSPPPCQPFEKQQVGLGMKCIDAYTEEWRKVLYVGAPSAGPYIYTNTTFNYQLQVPTSFQVGRANEAFVDRGPSVTISSDGSIPGAQGIAVTIHRDVNEWVNDYWARAALYGLHLSNESTKTINSIQWNYAVNNLSDGGGVEIYWVIHDNRVYEVTHHVPDSASAQAQAMIESFTFTTQ